MMMSSADGGPCLSASEIAVDGCGTSSVESDCGRMEIGLVQVAVVMMMTMNNSAAGRSTMAVVLLVHGDEEWSRVDAM